jgi:hypothetical protein
VENVRSIPEVLASAAAASEESRPPAEPQDTAHPQDAGSDPSKPNGRGLLNRFRQ